MENKKINPTTLSKPPPVELGIKSEYVPLHAHVAYFWETDKEFADAVGFLEAGLLGTDHCVIFGHDEANKAVCKILRERGFDVEGLQAKGRLTVLGGNLSGDKNLQTITITFKQAIAGGTPLVRLLGNIGWFKHNWPDQGDLLAFEAKLTNATKQFPCVVVCMYEMRGLPGHIVHHGGFETHPLIMRKDSVHKNPYYIPTDMFLEHLEAVAADIADRQRTEEMLRQTAHELRFLNDLIEQTNQPVTVSNLDGRLIRFNHAYEQLTGYSAEELQHMTYQELTPESWHEFEAEQITRLMNERTPVRYEKEYFRKDGAPIPVELVRDIYRNAAGEPEYLYAFVADITERKKAEKALRETLDQLSKKNRYESIISAVTRIVHQSIDLQEVLENAVEAMSKNIDKVQHVAIYLVEGEEAVMRSYRGYPDWFVERVRRIPYPKGLTWKIIKGGKLRYCADVDQDAAIGPAAMAARIKSYVSMPIFFEGKGVGALNISSLQKNIFDKDEIKLLEIVAQQIEVAINNAQQAEKLRKALLEVEQLKNRLQAENIYLQEEIKTEYNFEEIIGQSKALQKVLRRVEQVASTEATVLIQGETGTGKELIARAIHNLSPRKERPLVKVNCPALPAGLIESELFGHEKGAFTGALSHKVGRFELANDGTIFLDEIGDLPLELQAKLLRVLQEGEFERVGSSCTIRVDVRVIAATNRDLKKAMEEGKFRPDLYYRLNVFPILIPPLRERKEDIPVLVRYFTMKYGTKLEKKVETIPQKTMDALLAYPWPGNVRELENMIERAVILAHSPVIQIDESLDVRLDTGSQASISGSLEDVERAHILRVLEETKWVIHGKRGAALVLGLNPDTLRSRMKKLGIKRPGRNS
jgi:Nif-specific regulatory protein